MPLKNGVLAPEDDRAGEIRICTTLSVSEVIFGCCPYFICSRSGVGSLLSVVDSATPRVALIPGSGIVRPCKVWDRGLRRAPERTSAAADRASAARKGRPDCRGYPLYRAMNCCCSGSWCPHPSRREEMEHVLNSGTDPSGRNVSSQ